jgi:hypothetical protein
MCDEFDEGGTVRDARREPHEQHDPTDWWMVEKREREGEHENVMRGKEMCMELDDERNQRRGATTAADGSGCGERM